MQSSVEIDLAGRLESADRYIAELEIAKASAATDLDRLSAENKRLLQIVRHTIAQISRRPSRASAEVSAGVSYDGPETAA